MEWYAISSPSWLYSTLTYQEVFVKLCNVVYVTYISEILEKSLWKDGNKSPFADGRDSKTCAPEQWWRELVCLKTHSNRLNKVHDEEIVNICV
jgi:hypothetical protein